MIRQPELETARSYCLLFLLSTSVCAHPELVLTLDEGMNSPAFLTEGKPAKHIISHLINLHTSLQPSPGHHARARTPCACACVCIQSRKYVWKERQKGLLSIFHADIVPVYLPRHVFVILSTALKKKEPSFCQDFKQMFFQRGSSRPFRACLA